MSRVEGLERDQAAEQGGLPGARGPEQADNRAFRHGSGERVQDRLAGEALAQVGDTDHPASLRSRVRESRARGKLRARYSAAQASPGVNQSRRSAATMVMRLVSSTT